ncbi:unnamed protein product [Danaus chrysippus]|uniref:(African queen) hypothetical protein n=1 Tax=Danaus chrysippus TaxID=151541 RepID=A0A8J2VZF1_9NEOP|nr:unnamed protein product [Danaus chrysippus]
MLYGPPQMCCPPANGVSTMGTLQTRLGAYTSGIVSWPAHSHTFRLFYVSLRKERFFLGTVEASSLDFPISLQQRNCYRTLASRSQIDDPARK